MSTRFLIASAVLTASLVASWAADDKAKTAADDKAKPAAGDKAMGPAQKYLGDNDKNKDGSLSRDELPAGQREEFADLDKNKDGKLSVEELRPHVARLVFVPVPVEITSTYIVEAGGDPPTLAEVQNVYAMLRKADGNNDGTISQDEAKAARDHAIQARVDAAFKRHDANNDGKISKDECPNDMAGTFDRADKDNNGSVTKDELKACCTPDNKASAKADAKK